MKLLAVDMKSWRHATVIGNLPGTQSETGLEAIANALQILAPRRLERHVTSYNAEQLLKVSENDRLTVQRKCPPSEGKRRDGQDEQAGVEAAGGSGADRAG